ncbi:hypothetical protein CR513_22334, partial [Mucuna pruriens]
MKNSSKCFITWELDEEIYIEVPPKYKVVANFVYRLTRALYGSKQSTQAWFGRFTKAMNSSNTRPWKKLLYLLPWANLKLGNANDSAVMDTEQCLVGK